MTQTGTETGQVPTALRRVFAVTAGLFAVWGLAQWLYNTLLFKFIALFSFGPVAMAGMLMAFHVAYCAMVVPAVLFHRKFGFKLGVLAGLSVFGIGAFFLYLAIIEHTPAYFIGAVLVIGSCGAWLDTALNPLAAATGNIETTVRRVNLAHLFNGGGLLLGCFIGVAVLGKDYRLATGATAQISARPYVLVGLAAILLAFLFEQISLPAFASKGFDNAREAANRLRADLSTLWADKTMRGAAMALISYCAVLTILWTTNYRYAHVELPGHIVPVIERGWLWFVAGRLAGTVAMRWLPPMQLLAGSALLCLVAIAAGAILGGSVGWLALIAASFLLSITYPTVFGTALQQHWTRLAAATALLALAAGLGNAASSLLTSLTLDALLVQPRAVLLLALPFEAYIVFYALRACSPHSAAHAAPLAA